MSFSGRFVLNLIHFAGQRGASVPDLLSIFKRTESELCSEDARVSSRDYNACIEEAVRQTKDAHFGLHAGEYLNLSAAGIIGQITHTSRTVLEGLNYCAEFANLGCRSLPISLQESDGYIDILFTPDPEWMLESEDSVHQTADGMIAFTIREFQSLTREVHRPVHVELLRRQTDYAEHERVFQCVVRKSDRICIRLHIEHVHLPVITSDFNLLRTLVGFAQQKSDEITGSFSFYETVKKSMINMVRPEFPTLAMVASNLNMSVRTLQRRLAEEGYTFKDILEALRRDFAINYINNPQLSISEISYLLNYADSSAFIRSFKRWTGKTPTQYRQR